MASTNTLMLNLDRKFRLIECSLTPMKFKDRKLRRNCQVLKGGCKQIASYANDYNYSTIEANGFWSFIRVIDKFTDLVIESFSMNASRDYDPKLDSVSSAFTQYLEVVETIREATIRDDNSNYRKSDFDLSLMADADTMIIAFRQFLQMEENQKSLNNLGSFWLAPSMKKAQSVVSLIMAIFARLPFSLLSVIDRDYRSTLVTMCQQRATQSYPFAIWNFSELEIAKLITRYSMSKNINLRNVSVKDVMASRQNVYSIPSDGGSVKVNQLNSERMMMANNQTTKIRCVLFNTRNTLNREDNATLVLHCHGGGLVTHSPDSHQTYLKDWCSKLQLPVLSIDYTRHPSIFVPLQDVLDVYLWLTSKSLDLEMALGFIPQRIILVGDSAGGSLLLTFTLILGDINRNIMYQDEDAELIMEPSAFLAVYTGFKVLGASPSRMLMSMIDPVLSTGCILALADARVEDDYSDLDAKKSRLSFAYNLIPSIVSKTYSIVSKDLGYLFQAMKGMRGVPWYRKSNFHIKKRIFELQQITGHSPYMPAKADFSSTQKIPLHLLTTQFDPMLDDNVILANLWEGPVHLQVLDDLPHGFLNFSLVSPEAQDASDICVGILKKFSSSS